MTRTDRLTAIILLLQERPRTSGEIARSFEVSKRTIIRDVQSLCEMGVPVIAQDGVNGGYSLPPDYTLAPLRLNLHEVFLLQLALSAVDQVSEVPFPQARASLLAKLRALVPKSADQSGVARDLLTFDVPRRDRKAPFVETLLQCAQTGQWIRATYLSARGHSTPILLPKRLTNRGGFWYCEAWSHAHGEERTYRADRFADVAPIDPPESEAGPPSLPYDHPSHPLVVIELTPRGVMRAESDVHLGHAVQIREDRSGCWQFRCPPSELDWLARTLIALGPDARALSPPELIERIRESAKKIFEWYPER